MKHLTPIATFVAFLAIACNAIAAEPCNPLYRAELARLSPIADDAAEKLTALEQKEARSADRGMTAGAITLGAWAGIQSASDSRKEGAGRWAQFGNAVGGAFFGTLIGGMGGGAIAGNVSKFRHRNDRKNYEAIARSNMTASDAVALLNNATFLRDLDSHAIDPNSKEVTAKINSVLALIQRQPKNNESRLELAQALARNIVSADEQALICVDRKLLSASQIMAIAEQM